MDVTIYFELPNDDRVLRAKKIRELLAPTPTPCFPFGAKFWGFWVLGWFFRMNGVRREPSTSPPPAGLRRTGVPGLLRRTGTLPVLSFGVPGGMQGVIWRRARGFCVGWPGFGVRPNQLLACSRASANAES